MTAQHAFFCRFQKCVLCHIPHLSVRNAPVFPIFLQVVCRSYVLAVRDSPYILYHTLHIGQVAVCSKRIYNILLFSNSKNMFSRKDAMHDFSYNHFVGTRSIVLQVASIKPFVNDTGCLFGAAGKYANFYHFDDRCEADTALDLLCNAAAQVCEVHITSGFYIDWCPCRPDERCESGTRWKFHQMCSESPRSGWGIRLRP